jgi:hypothetical protein
VITSAQAISFHRHNLFSYGNRLSYYGEDPSLVGEFVTVGYLVAEQDTDQAVRIIKSNIARTADEVVA